MGISKEDLEDYLGLQTLPNSKNIERTLWHNTVCTSVLSFGTPTLGVNMRERCSSIIWNEWAQMESNKLKYYKICDHTRRECKMKRKDVVLHTLVKCCSFCSFSEIGGGLGLVADSNNHLLYKSMQATITGRSSTGNKNPYLTVRSPYLLSVNNNEMCKVTVAM